MRGLLVPLLLCATLGACTQATVHPNQVASPDGRFTAEYSWQAAALHEGEFQTLDLTLTRAPRDCREAGITAAVNARMPGHGHGLNYLPVVSTISPLHYQARGLMFHMGGEWELYLDFSCLGTTTRVVVPVTVS